MIRYRTRDLTRLLPGTARNMRRMEKITGRSDDMLIIRGVNVFPSQIEELVLKQPKLAPHYQLIVDKEGHLDSLSVQVEMRQEFNLISDAERIAVTKALELAIKFYVGVTAKMIIMPQGSIERSAGKAKRVIDKRK